MRAAGLLLLLAASSFAQVQNAADTAAGVYTSVLAPGSRAVVVTYSSNAGTSAGSAAVSLLPVNSATPFSAQVLSDSLNAITFVVPKDIPLGPAQLIYKPGGGRRSGRASRSFPPIFRCIARVRWGR